MLSAGDDIKCYNVKICGSATLKHCACSISCRPCTFVAKQVKHLLSIPFEAQGLAHCLPMQELIVPFPGVPVVVLGIERITIAALARSPRLRLG